MTCKITKYMCYINELLQNVEDGIKIFDEVHHEKGLTSLQELSSKLDILVALIVKIKAMLKLEKDRINQLKEGISTLQSLEKNIDQMLLFALLNTSESSLASNSLPTEKDGNKENVPQRSRGPRGGKAIPSLNFISDSDFRKVPKYTKGHSTLEQINEGINEVNIILEKKYKFLNQPRKVLTLKEEKKRAQYLEQAKYLKGTCYGTFFVDEDVSRYSTTLKLKKKSKDTIFLVLRHLGRMKEVHKGKLIFYCILCA